MVTSWGANYGGPSLVGQVGGQLWWAQFGLTSWGANYGGPSLVGQLWWDKWWEPQSEQLRAGLRAGLQVLQLRVVIPTLLFAQLDENAHNCLTGARPLAPLGSALESRTSASEMWNNDGNGRTTIENMKMVVQQSKI